MQEGNFKNSQLHLGRKVLVLIISITVSACLFGNTVGVEQDSTAIDSTIHIQRNPKTAILCSALLPGLGQVYNRKYWKVPLIYGAGGAMVYVFYYNQSKYVKFRDAYNEGDEQKIYIIDGYTRTYDQLPRGRDWYRRYRDISVVGIAAVYFLNIIDAMVDAYFTGFDVSDDLSFRIQPAIVDNFDLTAAVGIKFTVGF
ncbi:MAG: hypothetical protein JXR41_11840 [Bacteroidales bacterium]|nr:hypothetical protein [Bacteroidales bacterium]MBN2763775.1 hypothetical protein [Bacteroidales bacterium]